MATTLSIQSASDPNIATKTITFGNQDVTGVAYEDIKDVVGVYGGTEGNPTIVYFDNFEYRLALNSATNLVVNDDAKMLLFAGRFGEHLRPQDKLLRTSTNRLLVNGAGKFIRV